MALVVADRVKETTTSTGTGTINLAGAVTGFQTFVAGVGDTNTTYYAIIDPAGGTWEVGIGTVTDSTPDTLSRDTIIASSNSGSAVNFGAGNKNVFSTQPADKAVYLDSSGQLVIGGVAVTSTAAELNYVDGVTSNIQTQLDSKLNLSGGTMTGALTLSGAPTADNHATTKIYVDELIAAGIHYHDPVRVESPDSAGSLNATYNNGTSGVGATLTNNGTQAALVIDGVTLSTNDRVLIYNQTNAFENGIYTVTNTGSASTNWVLTRATDADSYGLGNQSLSEGTSIFVLEGDDGAGEVYACTTTGTITFGTTAINFSQIGRSAVITGNGGITVTSNVVSANVDATTQTTAANAVTSTASRTYAVQVDSSDDLVVNVPWTDTTTNQTITLSGDATGSGTTSISVSLATDSVGSNEIAANAVGASELNVTGDGTTSQFLRSDGDGSFTWATPTDTNTTYSAGSGLSLTGTTFANTAPDQTVTLTGSGATTVTGTYPNFTISSTDTDTNTTYSTATASTLGLVKIGYTENGKNYPVELSSGQMFVNVPWTDTDTNTTYSAGTGLTLSGTTFSLSSTANADTVDSLHASSFLRSDATDTFNCNGNVLQFDFDTAGRNSISFDLNGTRYWQFLHDNSGQDFNIDRVAGSGIVKVDGNKVWHAGNDGSGSGLDADLLDGNHASAFQPAANELTWVDQATGNYGTIKVDDDRGVTWAGYAIRDDWVFMSSGAGAVGIYNDTDNEWAIYCEQNSYVELRANGTHELSAQNGYGYAPNSMRSPIFYDSNNTAWFNNQAGLSRMNEVALGSSTGSSTSGYALDMYSGIHMHANQINYVDQLHFNDNVRFYDNGDDSYLNFKYGDTGGGGIRIVDGGGAVLGTLYGDGGDDIGLLNASGQWAIRVRNSTASNLFYCANNQEFEITTSYTNSMGSSRAPIFYDNNNTSYYTNPASTSVMNDIYLEGEIYHNGDTNTYLQFHAADQWRVVTGGSERFEVNNSRITISNAGFRAGTYGPTNNSGTFTPDFNNYNIFMINMTGNITLANTTTGIGGQTGVFLLYHSGGARTVSLGSYYQTVGGAGLTLSASSSVYDVVPYVILASGFVKLGNPILGIS